MVFESLRRGEGGRGHESWISPDCRGLHTLILRNCSISTVCIYIHLNITVQNIIIANYLNDFVENLFTVCHTIYSIPLST